MAILSRVLVPAMFCGAMACQAAQVYKCTDAEGKAVFSDVPCAPDAQPVEVRPAAPAPERGTAGPAASNALRPHAMVIRDQMRCENTRLDDWLRTLPAPPDETTRQSKRSEFHAACARMFPILPPTARIATNSPQPPRTMGPRTATSTPPSAADPTTSGNSPIGNASVGSLDAPRPPAPVAPARQGDAARNGAPGPMTSQGKPVPIAPLTPAEMAAVGVPSVSLPKEKAELVAGTAYLHLLAERCSLPDDFGKFLFFLDFLIQDSLGSGPRPSENDAKVLQSGLTALVDRQMAQSKARTCAQAWNKAAGLIQAVQKDQAQGKPAEKTDPARDKPPEKATAVR